MGQRLLVRMHSLWFRRHSSGRYVLMTIELSAAVVAKVTSLSGSRRKLALAAEEFRVAARGRVGVGEHQKVGVRVDPN